jgi:hypothetical protein
VNVRGAGKEQKPKPIPLEEFVRRIRAEKETRSLELHAAD